MRVRRISPRWPIEATIVPVGVRLYVFRDSAKFHFWEDLLPNQFAYFALFAWPFVSIMMFLRWPSDKAAIWSLLGGYLLLPSATSVDLPLVPPLDKFTIPAVSTLALCWMKGPQSPPGVKSSFIYLLLFASFVSPMLSTINNSYELQIGNRSLQGFYPLDGLKIGLHNVIMLAPFFIGMRFLSSGDSRLLLVRSLPAAALFYTLPMLVEIRLSPQFHRWVYGYFPGNLFAQQYRDGGFRPVVFLSHGLEAALFTSLAVIAALVLSRARLRIMGRSPKLVAGYLGVVLLLCKTLGATVYALVAAPICLLTGPRTWVRISIAILFIICAYPLLRTYDLIPVHHMTELADSINTDRAASFEMRVKNEDILLARANEKPIFGWGTWGRNRVYQQGSGEDLSVTDGGWILQYGIFGWIGYLAYFGLFAAAVLRASTVVGGPVTRDSTIVAGLSLLVAVNLLDLIPNDWLLPFTYLAAGSVAGSVRVPSGVQARRRRSKGSGPPVGRLSDPAALRR